MIKRNEKGQFIKGIHLTQKERKALSEIAKKKGFGKWMIGKKLSEEVKRKLSLLRKGKNNPFYGKHHTQEAIEKNRKAHLGLKGEKAYHWKGGKPKCIDCGKELASYYAKRCLQCEAKRRIGTKRTVETRKKLSEMKKGAKNNFWKGGISKENEKLRKSIEFRLWREAVFARDNWTCQKCEQKGGKLHPHHVQNFTDYPELRFALDNGITLCESVIKNFIKSLD